MFALWGYRGDLARVKYVALFKLANFRLNGRCEGTQIGWGGDLKKKRLDLTDWEQAEIQRAGQI